MTGAGHNAAILAGYLNLPYCSSLNTLFCDSQLRDEVLLPWYDFRASNYGRDTTKRPMAVRPIPLLARVPEINTAWLTVAPPFVLSQLPNGRAAYMVWLVTMHRLIEARPRLFDGRRSP